MKCLVIVDPQNDFLPGGTFDAPEEFLGALEKINWIRLKLFGCHNDDLIKIKEMSDKFTSKCNQKDKSPYDEICVSVVPENFPEAYIPEYNGCLRDIEDANTMGELYMFPFDIKGNPVYTNENYVTSTQGNEQEEIKDLHLPQHKDSEADYRSDVKGFGECQHVISGQKSTCDFFLHIITMDCHPPLHVSLAETHRIQYNKIQNRNKNKNELEEGRRPELENNIKEKEKGEQENSHDDHFLEGNEIKNLSGVMNNLDFIHDTRLVYHDIHSVNDIKEYEKLKFLNETIDIWPVHCVQKSRGYNIHKNFIRHWNDLIIKKGEDINQPGYSLFENEKKKAVLMEILKRKNIRQVYLCGFVFEYCVKMQAIDFFKSGFETFIIKDALGYLEKDREKIEDLKRMGIKFVSSQDIFV